MVSFFAGIQILRFWPKTRDHSKAFDSFFLCTHNSSLESDMKMYFALLWHE